ncbi:DUF1385 domain-containing protein [Candidatus Viridilinea mediisalina]|uniref:Metal-dependent enzyme n=1 Tax=Candidatus Viridilinea mediisalina TaxID=2024553 RepID=A0A2A6RHN9_9CHLR|nr:DUF1385 domain-containing protein [Candidatus Viridilinea mediisalina]PDW02532.1 hypothetical protein CJ255_13520 [Candidatus Viridilinea mediisalina]
MNEQRFAYGGQAVLEGVMMRGRHQATVAVRRPDGELVYKHFPLQGTPTSVWARMPIIRGLVGLREALGIGKQALDFSATVAIEEEEEELPVLMQWAIFGGALLIALGVFVLLPSMVANHFYTKFGLPLLARELIEGLINLSLVVAYIYAISRLNDIQRVFGYHGAEHKVINAYEAGAPLTVESVRSFTRIHPRCGTSFLVVAALIGFVIFLAVAVLPFWQRVGARVVLIPLVAAVALEFLRLTAANYHRPWVRRLLAPALSTQYLTTREPDDAMIATAIAALVPVLKADGVATVETEPVFALASGGQYHGAGR